MDIVCRTRLSFHAAGESGKVDRLNHFGSPARPLASMVWGGPVVRPHNGRTQRRWLGASITPINCATIVRWRLWLWGGSGKDCLIVVVGSLSCAPTTSLYRPSCVLVIATDGGGWVERAISSTPHADCWDGGVIKKPHRRTPITAEP